MLLRTCLLLVLGLSTARAESLRPQVQIDGGLSVIGAGYEHPLGAHVALQGEAAGRGGLTVAFLVVLCGFVFRLNIGLAIG